jgi:hypothetical protein
VTTNHFLLVPRTQRSTSAAGSGPILLCMGLFSRFCVQALRCTAHSVSKTRVNALMGRGAASGTRHR